MKTLVTNGHIVTATDDYVADIYIEDGIIKAIGSDFTSLYTADQTVDAEGNYVFPGGIDPHTHLDMPFMGTYTCDDFETGTTAALAGGTTTIIDYALQTRGDSMLTALDTWMERAKGKAVIDYGFHMGVTDFTDDTDQEIKALVERGVTSYKTFMAYKGALMLEGESMVGVMNSIKKYGGIMAVHAEDGDTVDRLVAENLEKGNTAPRYHYLSRPSSVEGKAAGEIIDLSYETGCPLYIVHTTCTEVLEHTYKSYLRGQNVLIETCPQYLLLDDSLYEKDGFEAAKWVMSPPLRKKHDQEALWKGLAAGHVQTVGTDHAPFNFVGQKDMGKDSFAKIPNGAPGIQHRLELMYSEGVCKNRITLNQFVDVTSTAAAKIFGLFPQKGTIAVGSDADLVIFDPKGKTTLSVKTHKHNCDYSSYEGWELTGQIIKVLKDGRVACDEGQMKVEKGQGRFLKRSIHRGNN